MNRRLRSHVARLLAGVLLTCLALASAPARPAFAQDPAAVAPGLSAVAFQNDRIRVLHNRYPPHQEIPVHSHPARLVIPILDGTARSIATDGTAREVRLAAGTVTWIEPQTHAVENPTGAPLEIIEVEFFNAGERGVAVAVPPGTGTNATAPSSSGSGTGPRDDEPVAVEAEPFHRTVFENQYVRVLELRLPPGATSRVHRSTRDVLEVQIGGGTLAVQKDGDGAWGAPVRYGPGSVGFAPDASAPRTRRLRNTGATEYRALLLQLLPAAARHAR